MPGAKSVEEYLTGGEYVHTFTNQEEYKALEKDAERYRYLRKFVMALTVTEFAVDETIAENRDKIIDSQIAKKKGIIL